MRKLEARPLDFSSRLNHCVRTPFTKSHVTSLSLFSLLFFSIHNIHLLQLSGHVIRAISGFILLNLIKDLGLGLDDFHICYVKVRSRKPS